MENSIVKGNGSDHTGPVRNSFLFVYSLTSSDVLLFM